MIVDIHNHYYPESYLAELAKGKSRARVENDAQGRMLIHYPGDYNVVAHGHRDIDERLRAMDEAGVDVQAFSLTTPGVHIEERARGIELAQLVNEAFADAARAHPGRFASLTALPLQDPEASVVELERAVTQLGHRGALLFSNINGRLLDDEAYLPLFTKLEELDVPALIHPTNPHHIDNIADYRLTALVGFLFDTTIAVSRLVFAGVLEKFPNLKLIAGHLGGTLPYVAERIGRGYEAYPECRERISRPPAEYFRKIYIDTVNYDPRVLRLGVEFAGTDRVIFGSDYPHQVGYVDRALAGVRSLDISEDEREAILGGTVARLMKL